MDLIEQQINTILNIRQKRVNTAQRISILRKSQRDQFEKQLVGAVNKLGMQQETARQLQQDSFQKLMDKRYPKVHEIVEFGKAQVHNVAVIRTSMVNIDACRIELDQAEKVYHASRQNLKKAEKSLIKIEEVVKDRLWES